MQRVCAVVICVVDYHHHAVVEIESSVYCLGDDVTALARILDC
jgi:hypothetical protein